MADATVTGTVTRVQSDPPMFTIAPTDPPPPPASIPFDCNDRQLTIATAAWSSGKAIKVTYPEGGGAATKVESA